MVEDNLNRVKTLVDGWRAATLTDAEERRLRRLARSAASDPLMQIEIAGMIGEEYADDLLLIDSIDKWVDAENGELSGTIPDFCADMEEYIHSLAMEEKRNAFRNAGRRAAMWSAASLAAVACSLGVFLMFDAGSDKSSLIAQIPKNEIRIAPVSDPHVTEDTVVYNNEQARTVDPERRMCRSAVTQNSRKEYSERRRAHTGTRSVTERTVSEMTSSAKLHAEARHQEYVQDMREVDEAINSMLGSHLAYVRGEIEDAAPQKTEVAWTDTSSDECNTIECVLGEGMSYMADATRGMFHDIGASLREMKLDTGEESFQ